MRKHVVTRVLLLGLLTICFLGTQDIMGGGKRRGGRLISPPRETLIFFTRHADDMVQLKETTGPDDPFATYAEDCFLFPIEGTDPVEYDDCCIEPINELGEKRSEVLANYFAERGFTGMLTHIIATHKVRTRQTITHIAQDAISMGNDLLPDDDQNPGDGIQQVPAYYVDDNGMAQYIEECTPGFLSSKSTRQPVLDAILDIHASGNNNVILAAGHSPQLYWVMRALGIDTSDDTDFPKKCKNEDNDPPCQNIDKNERVKGFNNLWVVVLSGDDDAELLDHLVFEFELDAESTVHPPGLNDDDDEDDDD